MGSPGEPPPVMCRGSSSGAASPGEKVVVLREKGAAWADPSAGVDGRADYDGFVFDFRL